MWLTRQTLSDCRQGFLLCQNSIAENCALEGRPSIAQRFSAGKSRGVTQVPEGRPSSRRVRHLSLVVLILDTKITGVRHFSRFLRQRMESYQNEDAAPRAGTRKVY
jgi:hypothetical protein